jgi:transcriptional regulator of nitric oxide reductase
MKHLRSNLIRAWRLALLAVAVMLIREAQDQRTLMEREANLTAERVRDFFPKADSVSSVPDAAGRHAVVDGSGQVIGYIAQTAPVSDDFIGYSGPTNTLLVFDQRGVVSGLRILKSGDTVDHLAEVVADRAFFTQFKGLKPGQPLAEGLHAVSGATLTSTAIAEGILAKLGEAAGVSLRFPREITLEEVRELLPEAAALSPSELRPSGMDVLDAGGDRIAVAVRTSPTTDTLVGYKGPTDTLMVLDRDGGKLERMRIRKSYDTERYVGYVTGDDYFMSLFDGTSLDELAVIDFKEAKVEGVSGATETSWAVAEGLKRRSAAILSEETLVPGWLASLRWRWQDAGHVGIIVMALVMAGSRLRGLVWARHLHHVILVIYGGWLVGEILSQGMLAGWARHGTPWRSAAGLVLMGAVALLAPVFTRRQLYCHHICPHGALQQLLMRRLPWQWSPPGWLNRSMSRLPWVLLALVFWVALRGWGIDLNALEPFDAYVIGVAGWASIGIAVVGLLFSLVTPMAYCRYGCPTGALFSLIRFTGDGDRFGQRDWVALAMLGAAFLLG